jgi:uncharacterized membrane protein (UPF0127 family)
VSDEPWEQRLAAVDTEDRGATVVHLARSWRERSRGLARMTPLPPGHALHLPRCRSIHTFGMRFALDLVWLDEGGAVVRVDHDVAPRRMRTCVPARSVLETAAGGGDELARAYA